MVKTVVKLFSSRYLKLSNDTLPTSTDLHVHIMYFNSSKILKLLGWFRIGAQMHFRPWGHSWLNQALIMNLDLLH